MGKHGRKQHVAEAIVGRRQALDDLGAADATVSAIERIEADDIARAVERTNFATGLDWPPTETEEI